MAKKATTAKDKKGIKKAAKPGRNPDGTFAKGNTIGVVNKGGRPTEEMSFRQQMKARASKDPELIQRILDNMIAIATDKDNPRSLEAADKLIKLNGNYDPVEVKGDLTGNVNTNIQNSPLDGLTKADLLKLLKRKK